MLYCQPELIEAQPKGSFAAHVRGQTKSAVPLSFPFGHMEALPRMGKAERTALQQRMRDRYAVHFSELGKDEELDDAETVECAPEAGSSPTSGCPAKARPEFKSAPPGHIDTNAGESW